MSHVEQKADSARSKMKIYMKKMIRRILVPRSRIQNPKPQKNSSLKNEDVEQKVM